MSLNVNPSNPFSIQPFHLGTKRRDNENTPPTSPTKVPTTPIKTRDPESNYQSPTANYNTPPSKVRRVASPIVYQVAAQATHQPPPQISNVPSTNWVLKLSPLAKSTPAIKLVPRENELVIEIQKFPAASHIHVVTLNTLATMALAEEKTSAVWYKRYAPLPEQPLPDSFVAIREGKELRVYVSTRHEIARGTQGKVSDVVRVLFMDGKCTAVETNTIVSHLSKLVGDANNTLSSVRQRKENRLQATHLLRNVNGFAITHDVCEYVNSKGITKLRVFYKKYQGNIVFGHQDWFDPNGLKPEAIVVNFKAIANQLGSALHHMHTRGLMHRDVKPDNILFEGNKLVITDLDLSETIGKTTAAGTPDYMAPEIIAHSFGFIRFKELLASLPGVDTFTEATDMYSLGVTLHELYYDRLPPLSLAVLELLKLNETNPLLAQGKRVETEGEFNVQLGREYAAYVTRKQQKVRLTHPKTPEELIQRLLSLIPSERPTAAQVSQFGNPSRKILFS